MKPLPPGKMRQSWQARRRQIMGTLLLLIVVGVMVPNLLFKVAPAQANPSSPDQGQQASPDNGNTSGSSNGAVDEAGLKLVNFLQPVMGVLRSILWPVLLMIGSLLNNDLLFGGPMEEKLRMVWGLIRDMVNIFFVLVLVGIALYNIFGGFKQDYHIKTMLPKFIIAIIAVNFSFLGVRVLIDGVNVISTGIFALPQAVQADLNKENMTKGMCEGIYGKKTDYLKNLNAAWQSYEEDKKKNKDASPPLCKKDADPPALNDADKDGKAMAKFFDTVNSRNAAIALAINFANISLIDNVPGFNAQQTTTPNLVLNFLLSLILYIVYATAFVALFIVLLIRIVVLWLMLVLSPLIVLNFVLPESIKSMLTGGEDIAKKLLKEAMVPIPVALNLSIGFVLLSALKNATFGGKDATISSSTMGIQLFSSGISTLQELIIAVACIAFVWQAVFDSMKDVYGGSIVTSMKDVVGRAGKTIAKLPLLAPVFPVKQADGTIKKASLGGIMEAGKALEQIPGEMERENAKKTFPGVFRGAHALSEELKGKTTWKDAANSIKGWEEGADALNPRFQAELAEWFKKHPTEATKAHVTSAEIERLEKGMREEEMKAFLHSKGIDIKATPKDAAKTGADAAKAGTDPAVQADADAEKALQTAAGETKVGLDRSQIDAYTQAGKYKDKLSPQQQKAIEALQKALKDHPDGKGIDKKVLEEAKGALEVIAADDALVGKMEKGDLAEVNELLGDISSGESKEHFQKLLTDSKVSDQKKLEDIKKKPGYKGSKLQQILDYKPAPPAAPPTPGAPPPATQPPPAAPGAPPPAAPPAAPTPPPH